MIVRDNGQPRGPANFRPRPQVTFKMVSMQFDETRNEQITAKVYTALRSPAFTHLNDTTVNDRDPTAHLSISQHDFRVRNDKFISRWRFRTVPWKRGGPRFGRERRRRGKLQEWRLHRAFGQK